MSVTSAWNAARKYVMSVGLAAMMSFPAFAQQSKPVASASNGGVTANTDCSKYKPGELMADTKCEGLKSRALDAQGRILDAELAKEN